MSGVKAGVKVGLSHIDVGFLRGAHISAHIHIDVCVGYFVVAIQERVYLIDVFISGGRVHLVEALSEITSLSASLHHSVFNTLGPFHCAFLGGTLELPHCFVLPRKMN